MGRSTCNGFAHALLALWANRTFALAGTRKGPSHPGFVEKAASRTLPTSDVAVLLSLGTERTICGFLDRNARRV
jgi:hypothetical protein